MILPEHGEGATHLQRLGRCVELSPLLKGLFCSEATFEIKQYSAESFEIN